MNRLDIKNAFATEIMGTEEFQTCYKIKDFIMTSIATPLIQETLKYEFETPQTESQLENIRLSQIIMFGFSSTDMTSNYCMIDMRKFLEN